MFREMRRKGQELSQEENIEILKRGSSGVLAVSGDDGYPYAVPLSYLYDDSKIYFHCALTGHKIDAIKRSDKVSFCVIDADDVVPEKFVTYYKSVIAFGKARVIENDAEKLEAIKKLTEKYSPNNEKTQEEIDLFWNKLCMVELSIEHMTGKAAKK